MLNRPYILIIAGPTGVGKSAFAELLADMIPAEIVNADMGQCYTPLTIGTAKPDWKHSDIAHHGFDTINEPRDLTVVAYREQIKSIVDDICQRGKLPILVGGSSFYLASLFFPPKAEVPAVPVCKESGIDTEYLWQQLAAIDRERAQQIDPHDTFRIKRALAIWQATGSKPSEYVPTYDSIAPYRMLLLTRDTTELNGRIEHRVADMLRYGWLEEVRALKGTPWEPFLLRKKIIGYDDILRFLDKPEPTQQDYFDLETKIVERTRQYAKRQRTFWRMLERKLKEHGGAADIVNLSDVCMHEYAQEIANSLKDKFDTAHPE